MAETRMRGSVDIRRATSQTASAPLALRELSDLVRLDGLHCLDDELRDSHPGLDDECLRPIGVQQDDAHLAAIAGVDESGAVEDRDPVLGGEPGPRLDEACVPRRNLDGQPGSDDRPLPRAELMALARGEIQPGVSLVRTIRHHGVLAQPSDPEARHGVAPFGVCSESATRYGAKRRSARRGSRARMRTPSGPSFRSSIGAPRSYSSASLPPSS